MIDLKWDDDRDISVESWQDLRAPLTMVTPDFCVFPDELNLMIERQKRVRIEEQARLQEKRKIIFQSFQNFEILSKWLTCSQCKINVVKSNVSICSKGHLCCYMCKFNSNYCQFEETSTRKCNLKIFHRKLDIYERLFNIIFQCPFQKDGCLKTGPLDPDHAKLCDYNPTFSCLFENCSSGANNEKLTGLRLKQLVQHMLQNHDTIIVGDLSRDFEVAFSKLNDQDHLTLILIPVVVRSLEMCVAIGIKRIGENILFRCILLNHCPKECTVRCRIKSNAGSSWINWTESPNPFSINDGIIDPENYGYICDWSTFKNQFVTTSKRLFFLMGVKIEKKS